MIELPRGRCTGGSRTDHQYQIPLLALKNEKLHRSHPFFVESQITDVK